MISRCVNWMWRCSRVCVCVCRMADRAPLTRHFHYLIAWKGRRGDCRSLAVQAKRMDLECISIGSKAPAVGGCPRPVGPSRRCRWAVPAPPPHPSVPSVSRLLHWKALRLHWAHTWCGSQSSRYLDVYREQRFATHLAQARPHCSTSLGVIWGPAHLISPPMGPPYSAAPDNFRTWKSGANHPWSLKPWEIVWY